MDIGLQVALGLTAALAWGVGDFASREPTGRLGTPATLFGLGAVGTVLVGAWLLLRGELPPPAPAHVWALAVGLGLANVAAGYLIFRCLYEGPISITSPISASYAAITFLLGVATGERAAPLALAGLLLVLVGVPLAATAPRRGDEPRKLTRGVAFAIAAALAYGVLFWALKYVTPQTGSEWMVLIMRSEALLGVAALVLFGVVTLPRGAGTGRAWAFAAGVGVFDTVALLSVTSGTTGGESAVVTAISSAYSVVTVAIAMAVLRERLAPHQWVGVALTIVGITLVALG